MAALPAMPGTYLMKNDRGEVIYVGKAVSLKNRVRSYFQKHGRDVSARTRRMVDEVVDFDWIVTDSELEALILECTLIKQHRPYYNVRMRDDKSYPYICVTLSEEWPRPVFMRKLKHGGSDGNRYFGPYASSESVRETLRLIRRVFQVPCGYKSPEQSKGRACLYYHIGQCTGVCAGEITRKEYLRVIKDVMLFLDGRQEKLIKELQVQMMDAAEKMLYEKAGRLRDQIHAVQRVIERQKVVSSALTDQDVVAVVTDDGSACAQMFFIRGGKLIGQEHFFLEGVSSENMCEGVQEFLKRYYQDAGHVPKEILLPCDIDEMDIIEDWLKHKRGSKVELHRPMRGEKRRLVDMARTNAELVMSQVKARIEQDDAVREEEMRALKESLSLPREPRRIEAYDVSTIQGSHSVGSLVVFENGRPKKADYRHFRIRLEQGHPDDYEMMREIISRRLNGTLRDTEAFRELPDLMLIDGGKGQLNAALEVLAATDSEVPTAGIAKQFEAIFVPGKSDPIMLPRNSHALRLLQRVRDEAHRFAIGYHRNLRKKKTTTSILDDIPGIGAKRRKALVKHFGSLRKIREASIEELAIAPSMNRQMAEMVYHHLKGGEPGEERK